MVKAHLLFMISVVSGFLLTLQLISLQILIRKNVKEEHTSWVTIKIKVHRINNYLSNQRFLKLVTNVAYRNGIPLFLVDPVILEIILNEFSPSEANDCRILCSRRLTHLATLGQHASHLHLERFAKTLRQLGLTVLQFDDLDQTLLHHNFKVLIPLHLIIFDENVDFKKQSHVVHIVIFHDRISSNSWWHGPIYLNEDDQRLLHRQGIKKNDFKLAHTSAIYEKVEIKQTTIDRLLINLPHPLQNFMQSQDEVKFIECNKTRASSFVAKYGQDDSEEANSFRAKAFVLLSKAIRLLDELKIPFWLSSGTCLGYFRQCDFITYSKDVDIGIWIDDYKPQLISSFSVNDLPLIHSFGRLNDSYELSFRDGDIKLDIFFFYKSDNYVWNGGTQAKSGLKFKYLFPKFTLCWTEFLELKVRVPCQTLQYVEANYGSNWFEPVKEWDWKCSPPNVRPNGQWSVEEWQEVIKIIPTEI